MKRNISNFILGLMFISIGCYTLYDVNHKKTEKEQLKMLIEQSDHDENWVNPDDYNSQPGKRFTLQIYGAAMLLVGVFICIRQRPLKFNNP